MPSVEVHLTRDDVLAYLRYVAEHDPPHQHHRTTQRARLKTWIIIHVALAIPLLAAGFMIHSHAGSAPRVMVIAPAVGLLALAYSLGVQYRAVNVDAVVAAYGHWLDQGQYQPFLGRQLVTLDDAGVHTGTVHGLTVRRWTTMRHVVETGSHVFIVSQVPDATVVPRSAFGTPREADAFARTARDYLAAAARPVAEHRPCASCGYDLHGNVSHVCPECGMRF